MRAVGIEVDGGPTLNTPRGRLFFLATRCAVFMSSAARLGNSSAIFWAASCR